MGIIYGSLNVDERYSSILEPNLYYDSVFVPGVTFTDDYEEGPAGAIYVHKLATSAATPGVPGRDFTDEATQDDLIPILLNNNFQKSKKIYGVQAAAVAISLANEQLSIATNEIKEGWGQSAFACLVNEGTVADDTTAIADGGAVAAFLAARTTASESKIKPDTLLCSPKFFSQLLDEAGDKFTPVKNDKIAATGAIGSYYGYNVVEGNGLSAASATYYDHTGTLRTVTLNDVDFILYNHTAFSIVSNLEVFRIVDSEMFNGSKAQGEMNTGYTVTNPAGVIIRKTA